MTDFNPLLCTGYPEEVIDLFSMENYSDDCTVRFTFTKKLIYQVRKQHRNGLDELGWLDKCGNKLFRWQNWSYRLFEKNHTFELFKILGKDEAEMLWGVFTSSVATYLRPHYGYDRETDEDVRVYAEYYMPPEFIEWISTTIMKYYRYHKMMCSTAIKDRFEDESNYLSWRFRNDAPPKEVIKALEDAAGKLPHKECSFILNLLRDDPELLGIPDQRVITIEMANILDALGYKEQALFLCFVIRRFSAERHGSNGCDAPFWNCCFPNEFDDGGFPWTHTWRDRRREAYYDAHPNLYEDFY